MGSHPASGGYKYRGLVLRDGGWACGLQPYPVKKKIVEKPPRNSAGFYGGGQGLSWAVEPRKVEGKLKTTATQLKKHMNENLIQKQKPKFNTDYKTRHWARFSVIFIHLPSSQPTFLRFISSNWQIPKRFPMKIQREFPVPPVRYSRPVTPLLHFTTT
jgi:hypothetical protein